MATSQAKELFSDDEVTTCSPSTTSARRRLRRWKILVLVLAVVAFVDKLLPRILTSVRDTDAASYFSVAEVRRHLQAVADLDWRCTGGGTPALAHKSGGTTRQLTSGTNSSGSSSSSAGNGTAAGGASSSASGSSSGSSCGSSGVEQCSHPHEAMFFLVKAIMIGTGVSFLITFKQLAWMQSTVVLFCLGAMLSLVLRVTKFSDELGVFGRSYDMWMEIDPHLLLFTMLPPLLAGDAMSIDTNTAMKVAKQCIFLAGPGVLCQALAFALFCWVYYGFKWEFLLCLTLGSILCATDPVAVVALLKQLGASPTLTVQIQGESLLNDGTAIVLYTVAYDMLKGIDYTIDEMIMFLIQSALGAWVFGTVVGYGFFLWIKSVKNHFDHNSSMIQVALTIACAYFNFVVAEGLFKLSGVLATVASSLVLAHSMWSEIVDVEMMHTIWHMLEYMGNTIIFLLAGALFGNVLVRVDIADWGHLIVIYLVLTVIRFVMLMGSRPLLTWLSADGIPVQTADCIVMTWGGLRGAVGLALAIQVNIDKADGQMPSADADRILFYVGGVAFLTLVVNAMTCPYLVKYLGITAMRDVRQKLILLIHHQMHKKVNDIEDGPVKHAMEEVLDETKECLRSSVASHAHHSGEHGPSHESSAQSVLKHAETKRASADNRTSQNQTLDLASFDRYQKLFDSIDAVEEDLESANQDNLKVLKEIMPKNDLLKQMGVMKENVQAKYDGMDPLMVRAVNKSFLSLVRFRYQEQVDLGVFTQKELGPLLGSITYAESKPCLDLEDLDDIVDWEKRRLKERNMKGLDNYDDIKDDDKRLRVYEWLHSTSTVILLGILITTNAVMNLVEPRCSTNACKVAFFFAEGMFAALFFMEFLIRFYVQKLGYFKCKWNVFDFTLVILSILGFCALSWSWAGQALSFFKMLRCFRLVRLIRLRAEVGSKKAVNPFNMMLCFTQAHIHSQHDLIFYFSAGDGKFMGCIAEVARCILESQLEVYRAMLVALKCLPELEEWIWRRTTTKMVNESTEIGEEMETFVEKAAEGGVLSEMEKESIIKIIHDHRKKLLLRIQQFDDAPGKCADSVGLSRSYCSSARASMIQQAIEDSRDEVHYEVHYAAHTDGEIIEPQQIFRETDTEKNIEATQSQTTEATSKAAPKAIRKKLKKPKTSPVNTRVCMEDLYDADDGDEAPLPTSIAKPEQVSNVDKPLTSEDSSAQQEAPPVPPVVLDASNIAKQIEDDAAVKDVAELPPGRDSVSVSAGSSSEKNTEPMPEPKIKGHGTLDDLTDMADKRKSAKAKVRKKRETHQTAVENLSDDTNHTSRSSPSTRDRKVKVSQVKKKVKPGGAAMAVGQDDSVPTPATIGATMPTLKDPNVSSDPKAPKTVSISTT